ncbi:pullulanase [Mycolicibacterium sediminis]|uniref:Pullulanase n=1 Tax=Mycolicibacterium sediminis TaxID=1286180 RepID=A0A7I7QLJ8_9MYCO|nr:pullulanase [Mycolicibacterium sediminis]BBY27181.1 hypothetical protein MSEDJ_12770 [Mycolicibacterium sediminis]
MDYCLGDGDGSATTWTAEPGLDLDGDGAEDAFGLDFDGDGLLDDALADLDGDGVVDHAVLDVGGDTEQRFTDDGSGTWSVSVDRGAQLRWFGLDGAESVGGPLVDFDGDGEADDRVLDADRDGLADRALAGTNTYVDTDRDGAWDVWLSDSDSDGAADSAGVP